MTPGMPGVWPFNNVATQNAYVTATTAVFPIGRTSFSLQVYNAVVMYQIIRFRPPNFYYLDDTEHYLAPVLANFSDPLKEGLDRGELFGGIAFRSAVAATPARVTVI